MPLLIFRCGGDCLQHARRAWLRKSRDASREPSKARSALSTGVIFLASFVVAAEALTKRFGNNQVLTNVTLGVAEREVVCVVGPSGSGKTTLLRCIALLEEPSDGRIVMLGKLISQARPTAEVRRARGGVRAGIGMVFQHFNLWPHMSVLGNVIEALLLVKRMPKEAAVALAESLLDKVGLADKRDAYPGRLSGGQQQRVAIARALAMAPKAMLFDD